MSWALVATAAAGLETGAGLYCALVDPPLPTSGAAAINMDAHWAAFKDKVGPKLTLSSGLTALSTGAALAAYFAGGDAKDPAWLTCALVSGTVPLYNLLVLSPTASLINNPVMDTQSTAERESWLASFGRKSLVTTGLAAAAFGCMLLVVGTPGAEGESKTGSSNPLRF